jgi:hypothetical protein
MSSARHRTPPKGLWLVLLLAIVVLAMLALLI